MSPDAAIDRIHYLIDRAQVLNGEGHTVEAILLVQQAEQIASELRKLTPVYS